MQNIATTCRNYIWHSDAYRVTEKDGRELKPL